MLKDTVRKFVDRELIPIERTARENNKLKPEVRVHLTAKAKELGLIGYDVPQQYGGLGMGLIAKVMVWAELGRTIALPDARGRHLRSQRPARSSLSPQRRAEEKVPAADDPGRTELVPRPDRARRRAAIPAACARPLLRQGDHYVINGMKRFITLAEDAHFTQLIAATDRAKGSRGGISAFIVDMKAPGVKLLRAQELVVDDRPWEIAFEDVKVPVEDRIGEEGDGFSHAQHWLNVGRICHGARSMGVIERCLELGTQYAKQRVTFGKPLAERQAVQWT